MVLGSMIIFQLIRSVLHLPDGIWVFGLALIAAAAANWFAGRNLNRQALRKVRSHRIRERLLYRARHRFMSLPMETFSIPIAAAGIGVLGFAAFLSASTLLAQDQCLDSGGAWRGGHCVH
jgi:hypothetical protein